MDELAQFGHWLAEMAMRHPRITGGLASVYLTGWGVGAFIDGFWRKPDERPAAVRAVKVIADIMQHAFTEPIRLAYRQITGLLRDLQSKEKEKEGPQQ